MTKRLVTFGLGAAVVNAAILTIGKAAGVPFTYVKHDPGEVGLGAVLLMTLATFAVGGIVALVARRLGHPFTRTLQATAVVLVVLSLLGLPGLDASLATKLGLTVLHVVVGAAYVLALSGPAAPYVGVEGVELRPARASATESLSAVSS